MDLYQLISYPLYAGGIMQVALGIALLKRAGNQERSMRAAAALFFTAAGFTLCTALSYTLESRGLDYNFFNRASWIGWFMIPACLQFAFYVQDENSRTAKRVGYILYSFWAVVFALTLFTDLVEPGDTSLIPFVDVDGPLEKPARLIGTLLAIWLLVELYRAKQRTVGLKKAQLNFFFYGTLFFNLGCILVAGILPLFGAINPSLTTFFSLPWVAVTYYAITRHRLFDLRFVLARVLSITVVVALFSVSQIALVKMLEPLLGEQFTMLFSLAVLAAVFFGTRLNRRVQQQVQHLILRNKYDYQKMLQESIHAVNTILGLDELLDHLVQSMKKSLGVDTAHLLLLDEEGRFYERQNRQRIQYRAEDSLIREAVAAYLFRSPRAVIREELEQLPDDGSRRAAHAMATAGADLAVPLLSKGKLRGMIFLGSKGGGEPYVQSDIDLLESLADHAVVAIENAQLYAAAVRTETSLRESEARFRVLAQTLPVGIFMHRGGKLLYVNSALQAISGYDEEELLQKEYWEPAHPAYRERAHEWTHSMLHGGQAYLEHELVIVTNKGKERWVLLRAGLVNFEEAPTVIAALFDITERKRAEEERERLLRHLEQMTRSLLESEEKFRTLADTAPSAIFIHRGGNFLYVNRAGLDMLGYSLEEVLLMDFWSVVLPEDRELVVARGRGRVQGEDHPQRYEFRVVTKSGAVRWLDITMAVIEYEGKPSALGTAFDITDSKRAAAEKVELLESRIAAEKKHVREKEKILMDLHDGIGGITTNISFLTELALKSDRLDRVRSTLTTIAGLSREGMSEIRNIMHSLDSRDVSWRTMAAELKSQGANMVEPHGLRFVAEVTVDEIEEQPSSLVWVNVFKIYKESLTNIIKHAEASTVALALHISRDELLMTVQDDGTSGRPQQGRGRGLSNMERRAAELGGRLDLSCGRGTRIRLIVPLPIIYPE